MKKFVILMVLALAACGEKTGTSPAVSAVPSVRDMLHNDALLDESFNSCQQSGGFDKAERTPLCANAFRAFNIRRSTHQLSRCGIQKGTPEEIKACYDKEYDKVNN
ncbi:hypothetical protein OZK63_39095 [Streptomyces sp. UMAF16]|nr:hypothetical protein [Streptomyces sp. UMAF16]